MFFFLDVDVQVIAVLNKDSDSDSDAESDEDIWTMTKEQRGREVRGVSGGWQGERLTLARLKLALKYDQKQVKRKNWFRKKLMSCGIMIN